jgi:hypothetical protein
MQMRFRRRDRYPRIFLNYRRDDSEAIAGRVHERLSTVFGEDDVFMDQFSLRPGEFYAWTLQQALAHAEAVVSLIGPKWSALMTKDTPLASERDFVRRELVAALDRGTTLFPVLVSGAGIPDVSRDHELSEMLDLQFHGLSTRHWSFDVDALVGAIRERLESARA